MIDTMFYVIATLAIISFFAIFYRRDAITALVASVLNIIALVSSLNVEKVLADGTVVHIQQKMLFYLFSVTSFIAIILTVMFALLAVIEINEEKKNW